MIRLFDERRGNFEIFGLEKAKSYLGEGFEECKDAYDIDKILKEKNCGEAGYRCEYMTHEQIDNIVKHGGDRAGKLNDAVADYLDTLNLSERAQNMIDTTDINILAGEFGGYTSEELEEIARKYELEDIRDEGREVGRNVAGDRDKLQVVIDKIEGGIRNKSSREVLEGFLLLSLSDFYGAGLDVIDYVLEHKDDDWIRGAETFMEAFNNEID